MTRNTKASSDNRGKPITAFFALAPKSSRQQSSLPNTSESRLPSQARVDTPHNGEIPSKSHPPNSHRLINVAIGADGSASGPLLPRRSDRMRQVSIQPVSVITSLKRTRDPDTQLTSPPTPKSDRVRTINRRKGKFGIGSEDDDNSGAVIHVKSPNPQKRKKARVCPPIESSRPSTSIFVPSSQSDEDELHPVGHCVSTATRGGATRGSKLSRDDGPNVMAVDDDDSRIPQDEIMKDDLSTSVKVIQMLTPPSSDLPSLPPTPVAPDSAKKSTQNIIADIKARAYAKRFSSPDSDQLDFQDDLDSSDDDELILPLPAPLPINTRSKGRRTDTAASTMHYSLRNRSSSPKPKIQVNPVKKGVDPFTTLLKEKHQAEKRGKGSEAIEKAELVVLQYDGKDSLLDEMENEENCEEISEWGTNISSGSIHDILNARNEQKDDSDLDLGEGDKERILGEAGGKTILKILEQDKAEKHKVVQDDKISGIHIWIQKADTKSSAMAVDEYYQIPGDGFVVSILKNSMKCGATVRTSLLLNMNLMSAAPPAERAGIASCLLEISLSANSCLGTDAAVNTLTNFWSSSMQPSTSTILFEDTLYCLKRFGVDPRVLSEQNWVGRNPGLCDNPHDRDIVITRLVGLITACARSDRLRSGEISDISIAMMLIGMDAGTSPALQRDITQAIDLSMRCLSRNDLRSRQIEFTFASRVLQMSASYSPANKLRLLSLMSNGSGPSRRIADFMAYCMITDKQSPTPNSYTDLPPLADVLNQLQSKLGIFALREGTDYIDLGFYVAILVVAVSNVKGYVSQERQKAKMESLSKMGDKPKTDLQLLHATLETLHSKISDSRAAHLERSRTKAAVKQLAMNIHYQREFWLKHTRESRSITLARFFGKN